MIVGASADGLRPGCRLYPGHMLLPSRIAGQHTLTEVEEATHAKAYRVVGELIAVQQRGLPVGHTGAQTSVPHRILTGEQKPRSHAELRQGGQLAQGPDQRMQAMGAGRELKIIALEEPIPAVSPFRSPTDGLSIQIEPVAFVSRDMDPNYGGCFSLEHTAVGRHKGWRR